MLPTVRRPTSSLPRWADLGLDIDRFFGNYGNAWNRPLTSWSTWAPPADMYETDDHYVVVMELPGYSQKDINVSVERGFLTVNGERSISESEGDYTYHIRERGDGRFTRAFSLPSAVNAEEVSAEYHDGMLQVTLPKTQEARPRRIEVSVK